MLQLARAVVSAAVPFREPWLKPAHPTSALHPQSAAETGAEPPPAPARFLPPSVPRSFAHREASTQCSNLAVASLDLHVRSRSQGPRHTPETAIHCHPSFR